VAFDPTHLWECTLSAGYVTIPYYFNWIVNRKPAKKEHRKSTQDE